MANVYHVQSNKGAYEVTTEKDHENHSKDDFKRVLATILATRVGALAHDIIITEYRILRKVK